VRLNQVGLLLGFGVLWVSMQFLGALGGPIPALLSAVLIGVLGMFAAHFFSLLDRPVWLLPVVLGGCSLLGLGITFLDRKFASFEWLAVPLCLLVSGGIVLLQTMSRKRCGPVRDAPLSCATKAAGASSIAAASSVSNIAFLSSLPRSSGGTALLARRPFMDAARSAWSPSNRPICGTAAAVADRSAAIAGIISTGSVLVVAGPFPTCQNL